MATSERHYGVKISDREPVGPPQSKLEAVREALAVNPNVFVAGSLPSYLDFRYVTGEPVITTRGVGYDQWVHFVVAPKDGEFDISRLEDFRQRLIPDLATNNDQPVSTGWNGEGMQFGYVMFDDLLAIRRRTTTDVVTEVEPEAVNNLGLKIGESVLRNQNEELKRRTAVTVVPHPLFAMVLRNEVLNQTSFLDPDAKHMRFGISERQLEQIRLMARHSYRGDSYQGVYFALLNIAREGHIKMLQEEVDRHRRLSSD